MKSNRQYFNMGTNKMTWTLHPIGELGALMEQWQSINHDGGASPLFDKDFILPLLREFGSGKEIVTCCRRDNRLDAMGILTPRGRGAWETFQPSQAPLGIWVQRTGVQWPELLGELIRKLPGFSLAVAVTQQDPQLLPRPAEDALLKTLDYVATAKITLSGTFDEYWNARGKNLRQNMKKQRNKLEKEGMVTRLQLTTAPEDVADAISDYGKLESAGWKAQLGTAIHPDNAQGRFYQSMLEAFCGRGAGRIYRYWYNDRIVAMDLCIEGPDSIVILKTTYDETIKDGSSPAFLLRQEQVQALFDEGRLDRIEFYGKVMDWHRKWTDEVRTLYHVNYYRFSALPRLRQMMKKRSAPIEQTQQE
jgi:CelD/BcsL family acetyltransferase involved in cellulose biosynthesis